MLKSINTWVFDSKRPLTEAVALAKRHGLEGVELTIAADGPLTPESTADGRSWLAVGGFPVITLDSLIHQMYLR